MQLLFSVSECNEAINQHLSFIKEIDVQGEISQLTVSQNKWVFMTLKDDNASVEVFALAWNLTNLASLEVGMSVVVSAQPGLYQKTGRFRLNASQITPTGEGAIKRAFEKLKTKLTQEGLFETDRKRPLPRFPQNIALLTAKNSQAYQDFTKIISNRVSGLHLSFFPVTVQGSNAVSEIVSVLEFLNKQKNYDLVVITRGGGSQEDLLVFNDERLVRSIFASKHPTICAIGHEGNECLAELAADVRASTPSNAAELAVPSAQEVHSQIDHKLTRLNAYLELYLSNYAHRLSQSITLMSQTMQNLVSNLLTPTLTLQNHLINLETRLSTLSVMSSTTITKIETLFAHRLNQEGLKLTNLSRLLSSYNPEHVLTLGYTITKDSKGATVTSTQSLSSGQTITTTFFDGTISSAIKLISNEKK